MQKRGGQEEGREAKKNVPVQSDIPNTVRKKNLRANKTATDHFVYRVQTPTRNQPLQSQKMQEQNMDTQREGKVQASPIRK